MTTTARAFRHLRMPATLQPDQCPAQAAPLLAAGVGDWSSDRPRKDFSARRNPGELPVAPWALATLAHNKQRILGTRGPAAPRLARTFPSTSSPRLPCDTTFFPAARRVNISPIVYVCQLHDSTRCRGLCSANIQRVVVNAAWGSDRLCVAGHGTLFGDRVGQRVSLSAWNKSGWHAGRFAKECATCDVFWAYWWTLRPPEKLRCSCEG